MAHIKTHYYTSHAHLNTYGIIPAHNGPDLSLPHGRGPPIPGLQA
jgi:putative glutathione S-transferase